MKLLLHGSNTMVILMYWVDILKSCKYNQNCGLIRRILNYFVQRRPVRGRKITIVDLKPLSSSPFWLVSHQGLWIILCKEAIQLAESFNLGIWNNGRMEEGPPKVFLQRYICKVALCHPMCWCNSNPSKFKKVNKKCRINPVLKHYTGIYKLIEIF
jgi:hypothetical protein